MTDADPASLVGQTIVLSYAASVPRLPTAIPRAFTLRFFR
jgi:hypothetical protein